MVVQQLLTNNVQKSWKNEENMKKYTYYWNRLHLQEMFVSKFKYMNINHFYFGMYFT